MAKLSFAAVSVSALLLAGAASATPEHFTSAWFFGDSLTDDGNLYDAIGVPPSPPYYDGRSSNGPVWADYIAEDFSAKGLANQNYAYAFATAAGNVDDQFGGYQVPDLAQQIASFKADANPLGARPLGLVWIGANDIFGAIEDQIPPVPQTVGAAAANAAAAVGKGIASLAQEGLKDFLVVNMPGLNLTPALSGSDDARALGAFATGVYNSFLDQALKSLGGAVNIQLVDVNSAFVDMVENPGDYGLDNVTQPCLIPPSMLLCTPEQAATHLFWDLVHPSGTVHEAIAGLVREDVAPVPLPASLVLILVGAAGIFGLGVRGRKARRT